MKRYFPDALPGFVSDKILNAMREKEISAPENGGAAAQHLQGISWARVVDAGAKGPKP
ncbi:MAG: hypothetical protein O3A01_07030 [bacterium]|nr:hypothetical protein [bacterium]